LWQPIIQIISDKTKKKTLENTKLYKAKQINTINEHNNQLWFCCLLRHSVRILGSLILRHSTTTSCCSSHSCIGRRCPSKWV